MQAGGIFVKYQSTRGNVEKVASARAILQGLAGDGGLFVPETLPQIDAGFIESLAKLSYEERAAKIIGLYLTDYTAGELLACTRAAYGGKKFDNVRVAPVRSFSDLSYLELWHGPTSAFKDMALQLLPQLMQTALKKTGKKEEILILVATSGDTGKAALDGFADVDQIKMLTFYPEGGVSDIQRLQMVTQTGENVAVVAVKGNFDDAQSGVKKIFNDAAFAGELKSAGVELSSANSINWGRLVPQIVYYFTSYADLVAAGRITAGETLDFTVPTGNFGDILAGYYAKRMGLPVGRLVCAANDNNVLTDFLTTGIYDRNRPFHKTISPSMDILISSNLERLLYHAAGSEKTSAWMAELASTGRYQVDEETLAAIRETFRAGWADQSATKEAIRSVYARDGYVLDPHTAVAYCVAKDYMRDEQSRTQMVVVSTASPYKFNDTVLEALGKGVPQDPMLALEALAGISDAPIPAGLASLKDATVRHDKVVEKEDMQRTVAAFAKS